MRKSTIERFLEKLVKEDRGYITECWIWIAGKNKNGYGNFRGKDSELIHGDKGRLAHRWAYNHYIGNIPEGLELDHLCRNVSCVNPEHLRAVTHKINMECGVNAGNRKTHCSKGHEYIGDNVLIRKRENGSTYQVCRICKREQERILYEKSKR